MLCPQYKGSILINNNVCIYFAIITGNNKIIKNIKYNKIKPGTQVLFIIIITSIYINPYLSYALSICAI